MFFRAQKQRLRQ
ncbi:hypothetical protein CP03DC29_0025A, partial [Chlamydia psittaci 03DC29]